MGSGHFLVNVVDEITKWIMGVLDRYPDAPLEREIENDRKRIIDEQKSKGIELDTDLLTFNVILKRMVMKRCVFGVDINPLAVELAKVSLWLDSFTIGTPLTFLDHHIRAGDSLIGLWMNNLKARKPDNTTLDGWMGSVETISDILQEISYPADLNIDEIKKSRENYEQFRKTSEPLRVLLDMQSAGIIDDELKKRLPPNLPLVEQTIRNGRLDKVVWSEPVYKSLGYAKSYRFFHWELEFPDAFTDKRKGFDLIVMNPPWDAVKPDDDDFFSQYYPGFRKIKSKVDKKKIKEKLLKDASIAKAHNSYLQAIENKMSFYKDSELYTKRGGGDTDMWKLFLERTLSLLSNDGTLSILLPSGVLNNEGATELRSELLDKQIIHLYEFDNIQGIFPAIHSDYKFVLLIATNRGTATDFPAAFYLHDMNALDGRVEQDKFLTMSGKFVKVVSPESFSIPEVRNQREVQLFTKLYSKHPIISDGISANQKWTFRFVREIDRTNAAHLFKTNGKGWPLIEGKHFHQFIPDYEKPDFTIDKEEGLKWTSKVREYGDLNRELHNVSRLAFRNFGGSTNIRSIIACILPKHTFSPNNASIVVPRMNGMLSLNGDYYRIISYLVGIFNSCVFDFLVFRRVFMNLNFFLVYQTPIPANLDSPLVDEIVQISAKLNCTDNKFQDLATAIGVPCSTLTMKQRLELTAKLDALVSHLYGLSKEEYQYVLGTFEDFREDSTIEDLAKINWDETLIKKFNGEMRKKAIVYYDDIQAKLTGENK